MSRHKTIVLHLSVTDWLFLFLSRNEDVVELLLAREADHSLTDCEGKWVSQWNVCLWDSFVKVNLW